MATAAAAVRTGNANARVEIGGRWWSIDLRHPDLNLGVAVRPYAKDSTVSSAFHLPKPSCEPTRSGSWVGSIESGASVNVPTLSLCVHGSCTHTECIGHIVPGEINLGDLEPVPPIVGGVLLHVDTETLGESDESYGSVNAVGSDLVVTAKSIRAALRRVLGCVEDGESFNFADERDAAFVEAVVLSLSLIHI